MTAGRILSTKKLTVSQRQYLLNAGLSVVDMNFISVSEIPFTPGEVGDHIIVTSSNAVRVVAQQDAGIFENRHVFCVGSKTASYVQTFCPASVVVAENAAELGSTIVSQYKERAFTFFCGRDRRDELPQILGASGVAYREVAVYETLLTPAKSVGDFDGVLFFSPSAVRSFFQENTVGAAVCFCIGDTTASALLPYTSNVIVSNHPTVENVIIQTIKYFQTRP